MNAYSNKTQKKREEYIVTQSAKSIIALTMFCMHKFWRCTPKTCKKRFDDLKAMLEMPEVMGKPLDDTDVIAYCKKYLDIDVNSLSIKISFDKSR